MRTPRGFSYAGANAGIKAVRKDTALFASEAPCSAAALFTINKARAAPVVDAASRVPSSGIRALVVNSGNANALTGPRGLEDVAIVRRAFAAELSIDDQAVLTASTGVIGVPLPTSKLAAAAPRLRASLRPGIEAAAEAILTTDTRPKIVERVLQLGGRDVTIAACAKGSGMIAPSLATMLAVITTDVAIAPEVLQGVLARAADRSFHELIVDGEMSTNDALFALANGLAGNAPLDEGTGDLALFEAVVTEMCEELARSIAEDGEGATKTLEVVVAGAPDERVARDLARTVAGSTLVKAAVFGADPNWGRVLATIGARAAARDLDVDPLASSVRIQGTLVFDRGAPARFEAPALRAKMREPRVLIEVDLARGAARGRALGCDLSYDYVKINADYAATITASAEGVVTRDDRLGNYTPAFKRALLVEALSYIARFAEKRAVVCVRGEALVKESLKASFASDINLLDAAGLHPVVVHGGAPEIARTMERLDSESEERVVEMVLTGRVNSDLVSLLNHETARAVGVSGKDGGLLRARRNEEGRGRLGDVTSVNAELLELFLGKGYIPVIAPIGLGDDGEGFHLETRAAAAEVAIAIKAEKLIVLADAPGIVESGELISELTADELRAKIDAGVVTAGMLALARSALRALEGGVARVHIVDGRVPHGIIAELFTDRGVGTLVVP